MYGKNSHSKIIEQIALGMHKAGLNHNYLELGISKGATFNRVAPLFEDCYAVDINKKALSFVDVHKNMHPYIMTTDDFFKEIPDELLFDMIFIDANHRYENVLADFENAIDHLTPQGLLLMHDTYLVKGWEEHQMDAYKIRSYIKNEWPKTYNIITFPFYFGITVVQFA